MGLGYTGDAMDYLQAQYDQDWERERPDDTRWGHGTKLGEF